MTAVEQPGVNPGEQAWHFVATQEGKPYEAATEVVDTRTLIETLTVPPQLISSLYRHVEEHGSVQHADSSPEAAKVSMVRRPHEVVFITVVGTQQDDGTFVADDAYLPRLTILRGDGVGESVDFTQELDQSGIPVYTAHRYAGY